MVHTTEGGVVIHGTDIYGYYSPQIEPFIDRLSKLLKNVDIELIAGTSIYTVIIRVKEFNVVGSVTINSLRTNEDGYLIYIHSLIIDMLARVCFSTEKVI